MAIFLVSSFVAFLFYHLFYFYSPLIWSAYTHLPLERFTTWSRWTMQEQHDGVEVFVLYPLVLLTIMAACAVYPFFLKARGPVVRFGSWFLASAGALMYYDSVGFYPPGMVLKIDMPAILFIAMMVSGVVVLGKYIERALVLKVLAVIVVFFVCMVPGRWFVTGYDYLWIFTPALRTLHGFSLPESYFQYDYLISMLVMGWMKLKLPLSLFHLVGSVSFFVLVAGIYGFSRKHFRHPWLAVYTAAAVMIVRIYANPTADTSVFPPATPLRLDWWLLVACLGLWQGFRHWSVGVSLGLLVIFHHAFGCIYAMSYGLFVLVLFLIELFDRKRSWREGVIKYVKEYGVNFWIIAGSALVYQLFLSPKSGLAAWNYQQYNIGFLPIARTSFFWYVPVMLACCAIYVWRNRSQFSEKYFQTTLLLVFFAVGDSFYFFGRSHESSIINISAVLLLVLFCILDMVHLKKVDGAPSQKNKLIPIAATVLIMGIAAVYATSAVARIKAQVVNVWQGPYKDTTARFMDTAMVSAITQGSSKVVVMSIVNDFDHYYALGIAPPGYYGFTNAWFLKKDYVDFLNDQLAKGYYLVMPSVELRAFMEILRELKPCQTAQVPGYVVMKAIEDKVK